MIDIRPISDLRNDFSNIEDTVNSTGGPIIFTKNGYGSMVVISLPKYTELIEKDYIESALDEAEEYAKKNPEDMKHSDVFDNLHSKVNDQQKI